MTKTQAAVLAALRAAIYGATREIDGVRRANVEVIYERVIDADEAGNRPISREDFYKAIGHFVGTGDLRDHGADAHTVTLPSLLKESDMFNVKKASMAELVAKFNEFFPDRPVKRFSDRKTAERRVDAALAGAETIDDSKAPADAPVPKKGVMKMGIAKGLRVEPAKKAKQLPLDGVEKKVRKTPEGSRLAERTIRHHVLVDGSEYKSVADAFRSLRLPMGKHIKFRGDLKTSPAGKLAFTVEGGKTYNFALVAK